MATIIRPAYTNMVDVLIPEKVLEREIDIYRHNKETIVEITFDEYLNFVNFVLEDIQYLYLPPLQIKSMVKEYQFKPTKEGLENLYRYYVLDTCMGALKELALAERRLKVASLIRFSSPSTNPKIFGLEGPSVEVDDEICFTFYRRMILCGYALPDKVSVDNQIIHDFIKRAVSLAASPNSGVFVIGGVTRNIQN